MCIVWVFIVHNLKLFSPNKLKARRTIIIFTVKSVHLILILLISDPNQKKAKKEAMDIDIFLDLQVNQFQQQQHMRRPRTYKVRDNPMETMNDVEFKRHFRFTKQHVLKLTELIAEDLISDTNRGLPIDPVLQVTIALNHYAGGHFQRITSWCAGVSQYY